MSYNETYKKYTWELLTSKYNKIEKGIVSEYQRFLNRNAKIQLSPNGTIMVDVNNMRPIILYELEHSVFVQACFLAFTDNEAIRYEEGKRNLLKKFNNSNEKYAQLSSAGYNTSVFLNRLTEYSETLNNDEIECVSTKTKCNSLSEKLAAMFTDFFIANEIENDFCPLNQAHERCLRYNNTEFAKSLFQFSVDTIKIIENQINPYIDGSVIKERTSLGVCTFCGGTFKGIFSKKCSRCGMPKGK